MDGFTAKFNLVIKALSLSRGRLAADLGIDKSAVGRWVTGAVTPSGHNLSRLTALVAERIPGFTALDWERPMADFVRRIGADPAVAGVVAPALVAGLPLPVLDQIRAATALRGAAYEGFFRSTRPYVLAPGRYVHDHGMVRFDEASGLLELRMGTGGTAVEGWMLPLHNQLFVVAADVTSGALLFGLFNGVAAPKAEVVDGIALGPSLDAARTPAAFMMMFERIGDLSGDRDADEARLAELTALDPVAPEGSVPPELERHLTPDIGPAALALGGELLLRLPISRSLARGEAYREPHSKAG